MPNVRRPVRELIPRIGIVPPLYVDTVESSPSVGMDETAKELARVRLHQLLLPALQGDRPLVLLARAMLRKQAAPQQPI
jgi:hypothetical protein